MIKCQKCGYQNDANAKFCEKCGAKLKQTKKGLFTSKWSYIIFVALIIACSIGIYSWISWAENHDFTFQEPNSNWTIENEDYGYSLNDYLYPSNDVSLTPTIYIGTSQSNSLNKELDVASEYTNESFTSIENGTTFVDNSKAYYFIYEYSSAYPYFSAPNIQNHTFKAEQIIFEKNGKVYSIVFRSLPQDFDALHGDFMVVVNSFKVKNSIL